LLEIKEKFANNDRIAYVLTKTIENITTAQSTQIIIEKKTGYIKQAYTDPYKDNKIEIDYVEFGPCGGNCTTTEITNSSDKLRTFVIKPNAMIEAKTPNTYIQDTQHISFEEFKDIYNQRDKDGQHRRQDTLFEISITNDGQIATLKEIYRP